MSIYEINPLEDARWRHFLERHECATLFHSPEWLRALERTYRYTASALTASAPGEPLTNGIVFCRVHSWLTGRRLVSVPFSDHCSPLTGTREEFHRLFSGLRQEADREKRKYLEIRSIAENAAMPAGLAHPPSFYLHRLDLRPSLDELFRALHEDCIRRKIARARRESLTYAIGRSDELLRKYYQLTILTRRRQHLPPQPLSWFRNLIACFGERATIRLAFHRGQPVAGVFTIRYKRVLTYKYGSSDARFHKLGAMQMLLWQAIREAKKDGLLELDMGRTDLSNQGLLTYKDRWGASRSSLVYLRYPAPQPVHRTSGLPGSIARRILAWAPDRVLAAAGNVLYRHIA